MKNIKKINIFEWLYERNKEVLITVNTTAKELVIPEYLLSKKTFDFRIGNKSSPNFYYDDKGISSPLQFKGIFHKCFFPWYSIVKFTDNKEVLVGYRYMGENIDTVQNFMNDKKNKPKIPSKKQSHLRLVK